MINNEVANKETLKNTEVKEINEVNKVEAKIPAKRVDIVSIKMVREGSVLYKNRKVSSPNDAVALIQDFLEDADREKFVVAYLNNRHEPTAIHTVSIGTLSSSLVHPIKSLGTVLFDFIKLRDKFKKPRSNTKI